MSIGSGLSGSFGWSKETVAYGTRVAPAKFIRHNGTTFEHIPNRAQGEGIQAGALGPRGDQLVETHEQSTASVDFDVTTLGVVQLMENLMGGSSSGALGGTAAYGHTFALADPYSATSKSLTLQTNVALRGGTDKAKEITGAKATSATFAVGIGERLTCAMEFDGRKWDDAQSLAAPSYVSGIPFHFKEANLKLGTFNSEAAVTGVRAVSVTVARPMDTEAFTFNASGLKSQPVLNGLTEITGTIEADYDATATFEERFTDLTLPSMVFECVGAVATGKAAIATTYFPTWRITLPGITIEGPSQNGNGFDVPRNTWNFRWVYDGTNLPSIYMITAETSV